LKGIENGWENTPRVRLSVLDPGANDTIDRPYPEWPIPGTQPKSLYLQADKTLSETASLSERNITYEVNGSASSIELSYKITQPIELIGYSKVRLWVEAVGSNDMELTVAIVKRDAAGKAYPAGKSPFTIASANLLRVSHRALDMQRSTPFEPYHLHTKEELLTPGEIVPIELALWPIALRFRPGEHLVLSIAATKIPEVAPTSMFATALVPQPADGGSFVPGSNAATISLGGPLSSLPSFVHAQGVKSPKSRNNGKHVIHFGGMFDSHVLMPWRL
jgi:predicted acyl esterase